jgi:alpha-beta hydrolase superfamily lysophospholipase
MHSKHFFSALAAFLSAFTLSNTIARAQPTSEEQVGLSSANVNFESIELPEWGLKLRTATYSPLSVTPQADVLFYCGFGDRFDNHTPLFAKLAQAGFRSIAFDLPGHGESTSDAGILNRFNLEDIGSMSGSVEQKYRENPSRPLFVVGWSLGGLLAVRMLQLDQFSPERTPEGIVLLAPAVSPRTLVGEMGIVTRRSLTRNPTPPTAGEIRPKSPFLSPVFAANIQWNAFRSRASIYPAVPTLVLIGDQRNDSYVDSSNVALWAANQNADHSAEIVVKQFIGAWHELDNEPGETGASVRAEVASFIEGRLNSVQ